MESLLLVVLGAVLIALVFVDVMATTLTIGTGAGPLTRRLLGPAWRGLLRVHRQDADSWLLSTAGTALLTSTVLLWVMLLWTGWALVFLSGPGAVVDAETGGAAGVADVVYYAGYTVFTLCVGDFVGGGPGWRLLTALASFSGLSLVTLAITYLLSVVSAVAARRAVAAHIRALGPSATQIVLRGWTGKGFSPTFVQHLTSLTGQLTSVAEQHLAYPVLHYFHSRAPDSAAPIAIARLDDALLLPGRALAEAARPHRSAIDPLRRAIDRYLTAAAVSSALPQAPAAPPVPRTEALAAAGMSLVDVSDYTRHASSEADRRRALARLVLADGWTWPSAAPGQDAPGGTTST